MLMGWGKPKESSTLKRVLDFSFSRTRFLTMLFTFEATSCHFGGVVFSFCLARLYNERINSEKTGA